MGLEEGQDRYGETKEMNEEQLQAENERLRSERDNLQSLLDEAHKISSQRATVNLKILSVESSERYYVNGVEIGDPYFDDYQDGNKFLARLFESLGLAVEVWWTDMEAQSVHIVFKTTPELEDEFFVVTPKERRQFETGPAAFAFYVSERPKYETEPKEAQAQ